MRRSNTALAALGLTALALFAAPGVAQADRTPSPDSVSETSQPSSASASEAAASLPDAAVAAAAPDGKLYAWVNANKGGAWCSWLNDDTNWSTCSGSSSSMNIRNLASSLENRGYAGSYDDVNLYWSTSYSGSRNCLPNGMYLNNLTGIYFLWDGKPGQGESMNDNISSHRWANSC